MENTTLKKYSYVYFIGVGGSGMSALARWFNTQNFKVFGYDRTPTSLTKKLINEGISIHYIDSIDDIPTEVLENISKTLVMYTPAISSSNTILKHLREKGYDVYKRAKIFEEITKQHFTVAIAGTHGKTITSSLMAHMLYNSGKKMAAFLGGIPKGYDSNFITNSQANDDSILVVEADEYDRFFLCLNTNIAIVTTADPDHLDIYGDEKNFKEAFKKFISQVPKTGHAIVHQKVAQDLELGASVVSYGLENKTVRAENNHIKDGCFCFDYVNANLSIPNIVLPLAGYHNVENAIAVITACLYLGLEPNNIRESMSTFKGVYRRFNYVIKQSNLVFIDDFAHHPVEITTLLNAVRTLYPHKKITAIFQPHTFTRTRDFDSGFAQSLDLADEVFLLDIYPAREEPIDGVTSKIIFDKMTVKQKTLCSKEQLMKLLTEHEKPEVILTIGAGDISDLVEPIKQLLLKKHQ